MLLCRTCYRPSRTAGRCSWSPCRGQPAPVPGLEGLVFEEFLNEGSFGAVYGFRAADGRERAVKITNLRATAGDAEKRRELQGTFDKERQVYERLKGHPNIVGFHGAFEVGDARLLVLDRVPTTVKKELEHADRMRLARATQIASDLADALAYAHAKGILHRDVKPDNIGLDAVGRAVLFDFGIARVHDGAGTFTVRDWGSLLYAAPEQKLGEPVGAAADVYGWAAVVFRLVMGKDHRRLTLREGHTREGLVAFFDQPLVEMTADPARPAALDTLLRCCLARHPGDRAPDMAKVQAQIETIAWQLQTGLPDLRVEVAQAQREVDAHRRAVEALEARRQAAQSGIADIEGRVEALRAQQRAAEAASAAAQAEAQTQQARAANARRAARAAQRAAAVGAARRWLPWAVAAALGVVGLVAGRWTASPDGAGAVAAPAAVEGGRQGDSHGEERGSPSGTHGGDPHARGSLDGRLGPALAHTDGGLARSLGSLDGRLAPVPDAGARRAPGPRAPVPGAEVFPATVHRSALVYIPGTGSEGFLMGSPKDEDGRNEDETQHRVVLSPFLMTATEVTQGQFAALTGERPSYFEGDDALPVERVSWYDAVAYANALSAKEGLDPCYDLENPKGKPFGGLEKGKAGDFGDYQAEVTPILDRAGRWRCTGYRLPTESEWEWAARGETTTRYWKGDAESDLAAVGWFAANSKGKTHLVAAEGADARNPFGLYDVHGNVFEWCHDRYGTYPTAKQTDPLGPDGGQGALRVVRGGSWDGVARWARSAGRVRWRPEGRNRNAGFRLARPAPPSSVLVH